MLKIKKRIKYKQSRFKFLSQKISNNIEKIILSSSETDSQCSCGCSRPIENFNSFLLTKYFSSKNTWIRLLGIRRDRISELSGISEMILNNGFTEFTFKSLDLYLVKSDVARQPWFPTDDLKKLAEKSLYTFCLYNNVAYWQGIHDIAAALVHLQPRPNVGELTSLLEKLVKIYAPILFSPTSNYVTNKANELSQKWRLLFRYFFPKASHEFDQFYDSSFSVGWFITLGFYRFGCAHISLAYTFILIVSQYDPLSSFLFRELGYIATRGYIDYLRKNDIQVDFNKSEIFSNYTETNVITKTLVNSNKIYVEPEKFINISKNLYDSLNDKQVEMGEFPLIYILKTSSLMMNSSPSIPLIDSTKYFVDITVSDILPTSKGVDLFESHFISTSRTDLCNINYRKNKFYKKSFFVKRKAFRFTNNFMNLFNKDKKCYNLSDYINSEIAFCYFNNLRVYSNLYRYNTMKIRPKVENTNFIVGNLYNTKLQYNLVDFRSAYLKSGVPLEKIFGSVNTSVVTSVNPSDVIEGSQLENNFTIWLFVTDDGYDVGNDQASTESLNNAFQLMYELSKASITCVTLLRGGYKGLLKSINSPVPQPPSIFSRLSVKKLMNWETTQTSEKTDKTTQNVESDSSKISDKNLNELASSVANAAGNIENRIIQGISDIKLFNRFKQQPTQPTSTSDTNKVAEKNKLIDKNKNKDKDNKVDKVSKPSQSGVATVQPASSEPFGLLHEVVEGYDVSKDQIFGLVGKNQLFETSNYRDKTETSGLLRSSRIKESSYSLYSYRKYTDSRTSTPFLYSVKLSLPKCKDITLRSNGSVKVNGIILHPYKYSNAVLDKGLNALFAFSNLFRINLVDGLIDVELECINTTSCIKNSSNTNSTSSSNCCRSETYDHCTINKYKVNTNKYFKICTDMMLTKYLVVISPMISTYLFKRTGISNVSNTTSRLDIPNACSFSIATNSIGIYDDYRIYGLMKYWKVLLIDKNSLIRHLVSCCFSTLKPEEVEQESFDSYSLDNCELVNYSNENEYGFDNDYNNNGTSSTKNSSNSNISYNNTNINNNNNGNNYEYNSKSSNFVNRLLDLTTKSYSTELENSRYGLHRLHESKNLKVFSRTNDVKTYDLSSRRSSSSSSSSHNNNQNSKSKTNLQYYSSLDTKLYVNTPTTTATTSTDTTTYNNTYNNSNCNSGNTTNTSTISNTTTNSNKQNYVNKMISSQQQSIHQQMSLGHNNVFVTRSSINKKHNPKS